MQFTRALLRPPPPSFAAGLTSSREGAPDVERALAQHQAYCSALEQCGVSLSVLSADAEFPDSCFVEDTSIVTARGAIATRPGAAERRAEVESVAAALRVWYPDLAQIEQPGLLDGGDVCDADGQFLIGLSARTNEAGAEQLAAWLAELGYASTVVDLRANRRLLHLKTGLSYIGDGRIVATADIPNISALSAYERIPVVEAERYAANCIRVNDRVLIAAGYPELAAALADCGYDLIPLEMSEFRKMDGGPSCLSLRF